MSVVGEAALVLGILSAAISIIDAVKTVYEAAEDASGLPADIRAVGVQLPLALSTLRSVDQVYQNKDNQDDETTENVDRTAQLCRGNGKELKVIFDKVIPPKGAGKVEQGLKAVRTVGKGKKVKTLMKEILDSLLLLQAHHIFKTAVDAEKLKKANEELARDETTEGGGQFHNYGDGSMYNNTGSGPQNSNEGSGTQNNNTHSGHGDFRIETGTKAP